MVNNKKVTYTLDQNVINIIERRSYISNISQSRWLSNCIQLVGYQMMVNDDDSTLVRERNRPNSIPKTYTLPKDVINILSWFSEKLGIKKSHLIIRCVLNFEKMESENASQRIKELM